MILVGGIVTAETDAFRCLPMNAQISLQRGILQSITTLFTSVVVDFKPRAVEYTKRSERLQKASAQGPGCVPRRRAARQRFPKAQRAPQQPMVDDGPRGSDARSWLWLERMARHIVVM